MGLRDADMIASTERAEALGLHPIAYPMGDGHHTDAPFTEEDGRLADALAYNMGSLLADVRDIGILSSYDEWLRVVRALRIHGLKIADREL